MHSGELCVRRTSAVDDTRETVRGTASFRAGIRRMLPSTVFERGRVSSGGCAAPDHAGGSSMTHSEKKPSAILRLRCASVLSLGILAWLPAQALTRVETALPDFDAAGGIRVGLVPGQAPSPERAAALQRLRGSSGAQLRLS